MTGHHSPQIESHSVMTLNVPNLDRLISHLEGLPEEKFDMRFLTWEAGCGTVGCIAGWCNVLRDRISDGSFEAAKWLGVVDCWPLFTPNNYFDHPELYPLPRAIRTLKHMRSEFLRTGEVVVDWDSPEPEPLKIWTAPKAVEQASDLPVEITRFLDSPYHVEAL